MRFASALTVLLLALPAAAIDRTEVMDRARAFSEHPWTCSAANLVVSSSCISGYQSEYVVGDHMGLPYDWGGWVSMHVFDEEIDAGEGAGTPAGGSWVACTTGLDCSGFVSQCWDTSQKYGTWTIYDVASVISTAQLQPGDAINDAGYHIVIYTGTLGDGSLLYHEANPPNVHLNWFSSWAGVSGFEPIRYNSIANGGSDYGSLSNPIRITNTPYTDNRDTTNAPSDLFDACGAVPATDESGREYIYEIEISAPSQLTASVTDGAGVDIDLHLYRDAAERDCIARDDTFLDVTLTACGTYYLVLDTWVGSSGTEYPGPYTLSVDVQPVGGSCQPMPEYDFLGGPGDDCISSNDPFCNPNLDVLTCVYSSGANPFSFCTRECNTTSDCLPDFPGGCCEPIGTGDDYCFPAAHCSGTEPDGGVVDGGSDGGVDAGIDAGSDPGPDAGTDAGGSDPGQDGGFDAGTDAGTSDAGTDAGSDGGFDAGPDAGIDAGGPDAGADAGSDAGGPDAGPDAGSDAGGPDAGTDAGTDAGVDAGPGADPGADAGADTGADPDIPCPSGYHRYEGGCVPDGWEPEAGGCGCHSSTPGTPLGLAFLLLLAWRRKG